MEFQIFEYFCFAPSYTRNAPTNRSQNNGNVPIASCITKWREAFPLGTFPFGNAISRSHGNVPKKYWCIRPQVAHHPHLVQTRGVLYASPAAQSRGEFPLGYLMEYMQEGSLHSVVHSRPAIEYETKDVLNWTRQAASALCYLHKKGILHRDVKPANMLLADQRKRLKLCDLGLSNTFDANLTSDVGTVLYMAPEVIAMTSTRTTTYGEKCDVYSLAVCIWEMVHRKVPFVSEGYDLFAIISKIRGKDGIRPTIDNACDKKIANMIRRCWSFDVDSRPSMESIFSFAVAELEKTDFFEIYE